MGDRVVEQAQAIAEQASGRGGQGERDSQAWIGGLKRGERGIAAVVGGGVSLFATFDIEVEVGGLILIYDRLVLCLQAAGAATRLRQFLTGLTAEGEDHVTSLGADVLNIAIQIGQVGACFVERNGARPCGVAATAGDKGECVIFLAGGLGDGLETGADGHVLIGSKIFAGK